MMRIRLFLLAAVLMMFVSLAVLIPATAQSIVPGSYMTSLNWSADGSLLAYGTGELVPPWGDSAQGGIARVIDRDGTIVIGINYPTPVTNTEVSPNGHLVFVTPSLEVFNLLTQQRITERPESIAFIHGTWHPTAELLALTGVRGVYVYDPTIQNAVTILTRSELQLNAAPDDWRTLSSTWSPDGILVAVSTTFGTIYVWDTNADTIPIQTTFSEHTSPVQHLVWNAATNLIASGDNSGRILVWNPDNGEVVRELSGHNAAILDIDWRADGMQIVSTSLDNTMRVWDWPSGNSQVVTSDQLVSAVAYSPDGTELAYGGEVTDPANIQIDIVPVSELVPTPSPTPTPTPAPTQAALQRVRLTSMCSANPAAYRVWRVRSTNPYDVVVDWSVYNSATGQAGFVVVPLAQGSTPGEITFITQTEPGPNTVRIFVNGVLQDTKASNPAPC